MGWHWGNLTTESGELDNEVAGTPTGHVFDSDGTQHVFYRTSDGELMELWWTGGADGLVDGEPSTSSTQQTTVTSPSSGGLAAAPAFRSSRTSPSAPEGDQSRPVAWPATCSRPREPSTCSSAHSPSRNAHLSQRSSSSGGRTAGLHISRTSTSERVRTHPPGRRGQERRRPTATRLATYLMPRPPSMCSTRRRRPDYSYLHEIIELWFST